MSALISRFMKGTLSTLILFLCERLLKENGSHYRDNTTKTLSPFPITSTQFDIFTESAEPITKVTGQKLPQFFC
jgi:hypothetical protein